MTPLREVAALFVRRDSIYKSMPGVDAWDASRNARDWPGGCPVVAHPPCAQWGQLRRFARDLPEQKALAPWAVEQVRKWGGVLEHPAGSTLWAECEMAEPGIWSDRDEWGGWTLAILQSDFGHKAAKTTRLYIVGVRPRDIPPVPLRLGEATHRIGLTRSPKGGGRRPEITKAEREHTPPALAEWLVDLARRVNA